MECRDLDEAITWAHRLPTYDHVEVRELMVLRLTCSRPLTAHPGSS